MSSNRVNETDKKVYGKREIMRKIVRQAIFLGVSYFILVLVIGHLLGPIFNVNSGQVVTVAITGATLFAILGYLNIIKVDV